MSVFTKVTRHKSDMTRTFFAIQFHTFRTTRIANFGIKCQPSGIGSWQIFCDQISVRFFKFSIFRRQIIERITNQLLFIIRRCPRTIQIIENEVIHLRRLLTIFHFACLINIASLKFAILKKPRHFDRKLLMQIPRVIA